MGRVAKLKRITRETNIEMNLNLDGEGCFKGSSGIGFLDHMLTLFAKHGFIDLEFKAEGDLFVDTHHTVEDIAIVLGSSIKEALGSKEGISRYGTSFVPMDETLATVSLDLSGRPFLVYEAAFTTDRIGQLDTEMIEEFFRALAVNGGITLHARVLYGRNNHHMAEALFKALGRALGEAVALDKRVKGVMSTKGTL